MTNDSSLLDRNGFGPRSRRLLRRAKYAIGAHEQLLPVLLRLTPEGTGRAITDGTALAIEGFPRSGNTFAVFAFRAANPGVRIASHVHQPAQIHRAIRQQCPIVVVVREPLDCLSSYLVAGPHAWPADVLAEYVAYHQTVLAVANDVMVVTFRSVVGAMGTVTDAINTRYGTDFAPFVHAPEALERVFSAIDIKHRRYHGTARHSRGVARPEDSRDAERDRHRQDLLDPSLAPLLRDATEIHNELWTIAAV